MNRLSGKITSIAIHALAWIAVFSLPPFFEFLIKGSIDRPPFSIVLIELQILALFYINYFFYIGRLLIDRRRGWRFIFVNLVTIIVLTLLVQGLRHIIVPLEAMPETEYNLVFMILGSVMSMGSQILVVGISVAVKMTGQWYEAQRMLQEQAKVHSQAELQHLKSQLNPHFLFNSLNNIYALIAMNPEKAQLSLQSLCDLLRYQLYEASREMITLQKEVEFVRSYCGLMALRLSKNVTLDIDLPDLRERVMIAPLLFISIIENAFKHGISQRESSRIAIRISLEQGRAECLVRNTNFPKSDADRSGSGIGLDNLRRRLDLLYPNAHIFRAGVEGGEFVAQLTIELH